MKKFLIGILCGFILAGLAGLVVGLALVRIGDRPPDIGDGSTLVLRLDGELPEIGAVDLPIPLLQTGSQTALIEVWDALRKAAVDERIEAVALEPAGLTAGWAKLDEIRDSLLRFKQSGKPLIAYLRGPSAREYYLASVADKIYLSQEDVLDVKGLRAEMMFYASALDKLGVEVEIEHAGRYKDAGDSFTRTSPTPETREVVNAMLDQVFGDFVNVVAEGRGLSPEQVTAMLDSGPFLAPHAQELGLVDGLLYEAEYLDELEKELDQTELRRVSLRDYASVSASSVGLGGSERIAFVVGQGSIFRGGAPAGLGEETANIFSAPFIRTLRDIADDDSIDGVILRVDSPGGDAIASDDILYAVKQLSEKKPLVVSMSDVAASGGYYIAMSGDPVLAYPNTVTGSIGVIYGKVNVQDLYEKLGLDVTIMSRGKMAEIDTAARPLTPEGRQKLRELIDHVYQSFLARVAQGRDSEVSEIAELAEGRVWMGAQAAGNGLVDELGGIDRAIELVKERAEIPAEENVRLVLYPPKRSFFAQLFGQTAETTMEARLHREVAKLAPGWDPRLFQPGGMLRLMPFHVQIR